MRGIGTGTLCASLAVTGLLGCVDVSGPRAPRILNEAEFREEIVGERLVWEDGETRYSADGTFAGLAKGKFLSGEWAYKDGKYCRSGSIEGEPFPFACETVKIAGKTVTFSGSGTTYIYTIKN